MFFIIVSGGGCSDLHGVMVADERIKSLSFHCYMESLLLLRSPFEEVLIIVPCLVGYTYPPCSHSPPPPYLFPFLLSRTLGPANEQLIGVYCFSDEDDALPHRLPSSSYSLAVAVVVD